MSAWANETRLVLTQREVESKTNEIATIPELLGPLELAGCIVTIDALGCQKDIASKIIARKDWGIENPLHWILDVALNFNIPKTAGLNSGYKR